MRKNDPTKNQQTETHPLLPSGEWEGFYCYNYVPLLHLQMGAGCRRVILNDLPHYPKHKNKADFTALSTSLELAWFGLVLLRTSLALADGRVVGSV